APAFFIRERPISSIAKPACMNRTSTAVITTHIVLLVVARSVTDGVAAEASAGTASTSSAASGRSRRGRNRMDTLLGPGTWEEPRYARPHPLWPPGECATPRAFAPGTRGPGGRLSASPRPPAPASGRAHAASAG